MKQTKQALERAKKLRIIEQIDLLLNTLDRPVSLYSSIVDTLSVMQLQAIKGELYLEVSLLETKEK